MSAEYTEWILFGSWFKQATYKKKIMRQSGNLNIDWMFDEIKELLIF